MADVATLMYGPAQVATTNTVVYTPPAAGAVVRNIHFYNTDTVAKTISLGIAATAATQANCVFYLLSIPPKVSFDWSGFLVLTNAASTLNLLQETATSITTTISGVAL